jgi:segregation and condensation protein A
MSPRDRRNNVEELSDGGLDPAGSVPASQAFKVALPHFEGPLDLLLHLIREHELDILDIPISLITDRYLEYLNNMQALDIDVAAEFLVMAATLAHIKSRMLLPREAKPDQPTPEEEGEDPREALVRRLLEYQKYKEAGQNLGARPILGRDTFARVPAVEDAPDLEIDSSEVSAFKLIEAFDSVIKRSKIRVPFEVALDRLSLSEAIDDVIGQLRAQGQQTFAQLLGPVDSQGNPGPLDRHRVVIVFLALLEMVKLRVLRIFVRSEDGKEDGEIVVALRGDGALPTDGGAPKDEYRS